jgi:glycosyltransferase involved in cell wall biosynthesis
MLRGEALAAAFASSDVFLFPSTTETLGMAMLEALASGLPVVAARSGASSEVVSHEESGLLYEPGSRGAFVEAVQQVVYNPELRERLSRGARAAAESRTWESSTMTLRGYYQEALGS